VHAPQWFGADAQASARKHARELWDEPLTLVHWAEL
jgi:hypothetical protein